MPRFSSFRPITPIRSPPINPTSAHWRLPESSSSSRSRRCARPGHIGGRSGALGGGHQAFQSSSQGCSPPRLDLLRAKAAATLLPVPPVASGRPGLKPQLDDATLPAATDEITRLERERDEQLANIDRIQANIRTLPRTRGQLGELERDRKRAAEALDIEVKKMAEAESQDSLISANRGDTSRIQAPANLPAQPNPPASWVMAHGVGHPRDAHRARRRALIGLSGPDGLQRVRVVEGHRPPRFGEHRSLRDSSLARFGRGHRAAGDGQAAIMEAIIDVR